MQHARDETSDGSRATQATTAHQTCMSNCRCQDVMLQGPWRPVPWSEQLSCTRENATGAHPRNSGIAWRTECRTDLPIRQCDCHSGSDVHARMKTTHSSARLGSLSPPYFRTIRHAPMDMPIPAVRAIPVNRNAMTSEEKNSNGRTLKYPQVASTEFAPARRPGMRAPFAPMPRPATVRSTA